MLEEDGLEMSNQESVINPAMKVVAESKTSVAQEAWQQLQQNYQSEVAGSRPKKTISLIPGKAAVSPENFVFMVDDK